MYYRQQTCFLHQKFPKNEQVNNTARTGYPIIHLLFSIGHTSFFTRCTSPSTGKGRIKSLTIHTHTKP